MKLVKVRLQGLMEEKELLIETEKFNLKEDFFDYMNGTKTDKNGNAVLGAMIGNDVYVRFSDVINISVEDVGENE